VLGPETMIHGIRTPDLRGHDATLLAYDETPANDLDFERRDKLRSFLRYCRLRLPPTEVGLPHSGRRRVQRLRRAEVAELIGVSFNWYSAFEGGRPVNVSPQFVSRVAKALRLNAKEELTLFCLAFSEMYRLLDRNDG
jgi:transcriptional regulator with XRE-family HTH domain